jgi:hypothetical protein
MRTTVVAAALLGGAVLATTVLTGPIAAAQPLPHNVDGGPSAGYRTAVSESGAAGVSWTEPAISCELNSSSPDYFDIEVILTGDGGSEEDAGIGGLCWNGTASLNDYLLSTDNPGLGGGTYNDPFGAGDAMSASITRDGEYYDMTITDATRGWSENRSVINEGNFADTEANIVVSDSGTTYSGSTEFGSVAFTDATVDGQPLGASNPTGLDSHQPDGSVNRTSPLTNGTDFTVTNES